MTQTTERLRNALKDIRSAHLPDQPATSSFDELGWAVQHIRRLRKIAADALDATTTETAEAEKSAYTRGVDAGLRAAAEYVERIGNYGWELTRTDILLLDVPPLDLDEVGCPKATACCPSEFWSLSRERAPNHHPISSRRRSNSTDRAVDRRPEDRRELG